MPVTETLLFRADETRSVLCMHITIIHLLSNDSQDSAGETTQCALKKGTVEAYRCGQTEQTGAEVSPPHYEQ